MAVKLIAESDALIAFLYPKWLLFWWHLLGVLTFFNLLSDLEDAYAFAG